MLVDTPWAFGASLEDDFSRDPAALAAMLGRPQSAVFAIEDLAPVPDRDPAWNVPLIAAAGIVRQSRVKFAHRARVWGVYVAADHRRSGLGGAVMRAAIDLARSWPGVDYVDLAVSERAPEARRLYERLGFVAWGREPEATRIEHQRSDEIHMTLRL